MAKSPQIAMLVCLMSPFLLYGQSTPSSAPSPNQASASEKVMLRDGTRVELRFAQALWGMAAGNRIRFVHAKPGDVVHLVVAADVTIGGRIVIQKGSAAQATVKDVWMPGVDKNGVRDTCTCMSLNLNWARSVDDQNIALRAAHKGKAGSFILQVHSTRAGAIAKPESFREGMIGALETPFLLNLRELIHRKDWVPAGTRFTAFVQGNVPLDDSAINEAQKSLPVPNETGLVMIYRTKGQKDKQVHVFCDAVEVGQLGSRQYVEIEMLPGKHSCQAEQSGKLEFSVASGGDLYLYVEYEIFSGNWKLSIANNLEGEDGIGAADQVSRAQPASESH